MHGVSYVRIFDLPVIIITQIESACNHLIFIFNVIAAREDLLHKQDALLTGLVRVEVISDLSFELFLRSQVRLQRPPQEGPVPLGPGPRFTIAFGVISPRK